MNGFNIEETKVPCPYDPIHMIRLSRMQFHLTKCAKNFPDVKLKTCPNHSTHKYRPEKEKEHLETCEFGQSLLDFFGERKPIEKYEPKVIVDRMPHQGETWDDTYTESYNPQRYAESNLIRRKMMVAPKSKKKEFRREEEIRFASLLNDMKSLSVNEPFTASKPGGDEPAKKSATAKCGTSTAKKEVSFSDTVGKRGVRAVSKTRGGGGDNDDDDGDETASYTTETQSIVTTTTNRTEETTATSKTATSATSATSATASTTTIDYGKQRKLVLGVNFNLANGSTTKAPAKVAKKPEEKQAAVTKPGPSM